MKHEVDFTEAVRKVQWWVDRGFYPGAGLLIGRRDQIFFEKYFGLYGPETEEFVASGGKWLAAAAIAAIVDEGALSWDDKVARWLPQFVDEAGEVRLRQLLSHTSGFAPQQPPGRRSDDYQTLEESVSHIATLPLADRPGRRFLYGGLAMQVAGAWGSSRRGSSLQYLFDRLLARPLGLAHTRFTPVDAAPGHNPMLAGGARSSARDYARFLAMIADGGRFGGKQILSASSVEEMQRDQVREAKVEPGQFVERVRSARHSGVYGLGLWRERVDSAGRAVQVSSPSWAGSYPWVDKQRDIYGVLIAHVDLNGPPWDEGFNPFYSSAEVADLVGAALDRGGANPLPP